MAYIDSIRGKHLVDLTKDELAFIHLKAPKSGFEIYEGIIKSGLPILIQEINHVKCNIYSKNLVPIISSFAILDQLGYCYKRNDIPEYSNSNASGVKKALYYLCDFFDESADIQALNAFKKGLMHNGSLLSRGRGKNACHYSFIYDENLTVVIEQASAAWDGDFSHLQHPSMLTKVNPAKIIELAQNAVYKAGELLEAGNIEVVIREIEMYYTFLNCLQRAKIK